MSLSAFAQTIYEAKYKQGDEEWPDTARRVVTNVVGPYLPELVDELTQVITDRKFLPGGRYLYAAGKPVHQVNNCLLLTVEDSREGWADLMRRVTNGLMTGAGVGIDYSKLRPNGAPVRGMGGTSTGPMALMQMVNETGRHIMQGGSRRAAIWAGLRWDHADVLDFIHLKDWSKEIRAAKEADFNFPAPLDGTNISVILNDAFFAAYRDMNDPMHDWAHKVYWDAVESMLKTGEPGFSVNTGANRNESLRNACTEITSEDDNDICNLGSINLARIYTKEEFARIVELGTAFLLCGSVYGLVPYEEVADVREKNRRLGLGLMGIYEWLALRGKHYGPDFELAKWLAEYAKSTEIAARYADRLGVSRPIKTRAIAPTGTIGILGETTTGIEPVYAVAYKRRYLVGTDWKWQYVIEPVAKRIADQGHDPDKLDTAFSLAQNPSVRLEMQEWVQIFVDHGISSTINLPSFEAQAFDPGDFAVMLMDYLPHIRGITVYPDGARGGQPLTVVPYAEAIEWEGYEFDEVANSVACPSGVCGV